MNREAERKRLVELLKDGHSLYIRAISGKTMYEEIADHLLDNGIVVPPVKVGDKVYVVSMVVDNHSPVSVCLSNGKELTISLNNIEMILDEKVFEKGGER